MIKCIQWLVDSYFLNFIILAPLNNVPLMSNSVVFFNEEKVVFYSVSEDFSTWNRKIKSWVLESKHREINHFLTNLYAYFYTLTLRYPHWYLLAWHPAKYMHLRICILTHLTIWITLEKSLLKKDREFLRIITRKKDLKPGRSRSGLQSAIILSSDLKSLDRDWLGMVIWNLDPNTRNFPIFKYIILKFRQKFKSACDCGILESRSFISRIFPV